MLGVGCLLGFLILTNTQASICLSVSLSHTMGDKTEENVAWESYKA